MRGGELREFGYVNTSDASKRTHFYVWSPIKEKLVKRKIAALMAADIAEYSRLVAEDEEETLRRLSAYRSVTDEFIKRASGRIFNTAGDSVLAEFPSTVEAVRCAIDIQESLRTRNLAYPQSRQMKFRIGITVGDVVDRDGDLLGDAVNVAARLQTLAEAGGICVSHAVYEQVTNKISVIFADIGEQQVKNIPRPVRAYVVAMQGAPSEVLPASQKKRARVTAGAIIAIVCVAGLFGAAAYTFTLGRVPSYNSETAPRNDSSSSALRLSDPAKTECTRRTAAARVFASEPPRGSGALGYGEEAYVNDGQCPAGYIKQITGGGPGVSRRVQCVQC
jgi:class 3 adenylate cyclase